MSIYGALYTGVTGLAAQSTAIGVISDNIANINTVGYKSTTTNFSTLVTQSATETSYNPGGVIAAPLSNISLQGQLRATETASDLALVGEGFFVVSDGSQASDEYLFTRAGSFRADSNGYLRNTANYYLQGYPLTNGSQARTSASTFAGLEPVNIGGLETVVKATSNIELALNLPSGGDAPVATTNVQQALNLSSGAAPGDTYDVTTEVYDDQGNAHAITTTYSKTANPDEWTVSITAPNAGAATAIGGPFTVTFDSTTGLLTGNVPTISAQFAWNTGASNSTITIDIGTAGSATGAKQIGNNYSTSLSKQIDGTLPAKEVVTVQVFDGIGNAHNIDLTFRKTGPNKWSVEADDPTMNGKKSGTIAKAGRTITFDDGLPDSITMPPLIIAWDGASPTTITLDVGAAGDAAGLTQFAGDFLIHSTEQDGIPLGNYVGVSISDTGLVKAILDNGQTLDIYQLATATVPNPNGLDARSGNAYTITETSGTFTLNIPGSGGTGKIASAALETSNVDLATEFTNMIVVQQAYSASSQIITTADEMLDELIRIIR